MKRKLYWFTCLVCKKSFPSYIHLLYCGDCCREVLK